MRQSRIEQQEAGNDVENINGLSWKYKWSQCGTKRSAANWFYFLPIHSVGNQICNLCLSGGLPGLPGGDFEDFEKDHSSWWQPYLQSWNHQHPRFMFIIFWPFSIHTIMMMMMMILVSVCVNVEVSWRPVNAQSGARSKGQPGQVFLKRSRRWEILCFWQLHRHIGAQSCPEWIFWWSRSNYLKAGYLMIGINGEGQRSTKYTIIN